MRWIYNLKINIRKYTNVIFIEKCGNTWRLCKDVHSFFQKMSNDNNNILFKKCEMIFIMSTLFYDFKST